MSPGAPGADEVSSTTRGVVVMKPGADAKSPDAQSLYSDEGATLDDLREAVTALEDAGRIAQRVFGGTHPLTVDIEHDLRNAQLGAALRANEETQP